MAVFDPTREAGIRFFLDDEIIEITNVSPTHTLLDYLRESLHRTGSKEGCAEGDCGACTVVVASTKDNGQVAYQGINSCIAFLPTLDGKVVFTVESLKKINHGNLHPVQSAMVAEHGSQCGFCTPGFVMSLFALYQSKAEYDEQQTRKCLAGNLCRCTGYRPILAAADRALGDQSFDREALEQKVKQQLKQIKISQNKELIFSEQKYFAPTDLESLIELYDEHSDATILSGGTDVGLWVTKQDRKLKKIIYIGEVAELKKIMVAESQIEIGAAVTLTQAEKTLAQHSPEFSEVLSRFASPGIRNSGTLCGNVANGSPIGDLMPCLIVLNAKVKLGSAQGERSLNLEDFYLGYQQKDIAPGEFVQSVVIPERSSFVQFRAYKVAKRYDQDISAVLGAFSVSLVKGKIESARVCFGGMAAVPQRALKTEQLLTGKNLEDNLIERAAVMLTSEYQPLTDMRASAAYRSQVAGNLLRRFFIEVQATGAAEQNIPVSIWQPNDEAAV